MIDLKAVRKRVGGLGGTIPGCLLIASEDFHDLCEEIERLQRDSRAMDVIRQHAPLAIGRIGEDKYWAGLGQGPVYAADPAEALLKAAKTVGGKR